MDRRAKIDKVRASRDGHENHEAWTARKSLQLLWPESDLRAIAVEGLSPADQVRASAQTVEIADIVLYYGGRPTFQEASQTTFAQFKYSIAERDEPFRASHAKKTIQKFAATYLEYKRTFGVQAVQKKLDFQLITNQPIYDPLLRAIDATAKRLPCKGEIEKQASQFKAAAGLDGNHLAAFAAKCKLVGRSGSLVAIKYEVANLLVDWSATNDPIAAARLGQLRDMVRQKAGSAGTNQNLISRTDVLAALNVGDPEDLLPCKTALADVGNVVEREQLADAIALIPTLSAPLLVHAAGGVGKTVFIDSLAAKMSEHHEVLLFDCFGGGAYRSPEDARHLPKRGLIHIANTLAFRSLCDPMLPENPDVESLLRTFRRRLQQCVDTISRTVPGRELVLLIDAIDNAQIAAHQRSDDCFPVKLLESLHTEPIPGIRLVVSCRTERKPSTYAKYYQLELRPFSMNETATFLRARLENVSSVEINVAQARSGGNPRVLDQLVRSGRGVLDESEIDTKVELEDLIQNRITDALDIAIERGSKQSDIDIFLAGLAVLPPPVPLDEYAGAQGIEVSAIKSFASDLFPLLELSNQGLMFKDEPTETLVRKRYASSTEALHRVAANLLTRQNISVYAARALPGLLHELDDGEQLFALAFDDRIPSSIKSTVGKRNVRYARLKAATLHAAMKEDYDQLVHLLLELSTIAAVDQRGAAYLVDYPDLVVAAKDVDATRRLFETRTRWPGTRHARLAIANTLSGDFQEAYRHIVATDEWISHYLRNQQADRMQEPGPERPDIAAIPFFLATQGSARAAASFLRRWREWYVFEVCEYVFDYLHFVQSTNFRWSRRSAGFVEALGDIGSLTAALVFQNLPRLKRMEVIAKLAKLGRRKTKIEHPEFYERDQRYRLQDGLRKASAMALQLGLRTEALQISLLAPHTRRNIWSFDNFFYHTDVFPFMFRTALVAAAKNNSIHEKDVLPSELTSLCSRIAKNISGKAFRDKAKDCLRKHRERQKEAKQHDPLPYDELLRFIDRRLGPLLALTRALSAVLAAPSRNVDKEFLKLLNVWEEARKNRDPYQTGSTDHFFRMLGLDASRFTLEVRNELKPASVEKFLTTVCALDFGAHNLVQIVSILARRPLLHDLAGSLALNARKLIEAEHDVTHRASLLAGLGRAMLPASIDEASVYFRDGLEQMDAIGSGDYEFTNELLLFASSIKGPELDEGAFHTLSNICELNIGEEPGKFFWDAYGHGLSKTAGPRGLAKLSRLDDRAIVALEYTLLPYLKALVEDGKLEPQDALALNRLAAPVEYYHCGTKDFALVIREKAGPEASIVSELVKQFEDNNPRVSMDSTVEVLTSLAGEALGQSSETFRYLAAARKRNMSLRDTQGYYQNNRRTGRLGRADETDGENRAALDRIAATTDPTQADSLVLAIDVFNRLQNRYELREWFFRSLRARVPFSARAQYVRDICSMEHLFFYWKLAELKECKQKWARSSASLNAVFKSAAFSLVHLHADDLVESGRLSGTGLNEISDLSGVPIAELVLELIKAFARPDSAVSGAVWLAFGTFICPRVGDGEGQAAITRLLSSDAAKLADNVADGGIVNGLYPKDDVTTIAAGLVWRTLGSPYADARWRAAHSARCFARFGRWEIIEALVEKLSATNAGSFQAPELAFFYLHARLWLLIALARIALDHPKEIARFKDSLFVIADKSSPHVLMRHFASSALLSCLNAGELKLTAAAEESLRAADTSPHARLKKKTGNGGDFYHGRAVGSQKPEFEFHLDYDFQKSDVDSLGYVFGKPCWEVADMMSVIAHDLDPDVPSMYESGGRVSRYRDSGHAISTRHHSLGQQLGWHALFIAAGKLLSNWPVTDDWWYQDDPWGEWLGRYVLTRSDGLWLSEGTDLTPIDTREILMEPKKHGLAITGEPDKLLRLAELTSSVGKELVVEGRWFSSDNIRVQISSALAPRDKAARFARKLAREEPILVWIPVFQESEGDLEHLIGEKKEYTPWIVCPSGEARLDEHDPYGAACANLRPRLARDFATSCSLTINDPFGRIWQNKRGRPVLRAQAWGREDRYSEEGPHSGLRLFCASSVLKEILTKHDKDLLLLIQLQRYEKGYQGDSKFSHTVGVSRINKNLDLEYFKGPINHLHKSKF